MYTSLSWCLFTNLSTCYGLTSCKLQKTLTPVDTTAPMGGIHQPKGTNGMHQNREEIEVVTLACKVATLCLLGLNSHRFAINLVVIKLLWGEEDAVKWTCTDNKLP